MINNLEEQKSNLNPSPLSIELFKKYHAEKSIRRMVKEHLRGIDLDEKELTCHSLRHTFATFALANNAPLLAVQKAMRHSNINTTTIYTHMIDRLTDGAEHYIDL